MKRRILHISVDVYRYINRDDEKWLSAAISTGYDCAICCEPALPDEVNPASVLVNVNDDDLGQWIIRFAHATCSPSRVRLVNGLEPGPANLWAWPALAMLRPAPAEPIPILLISPDTDRPDTEPVGNGESIDRHTSDLLRQGFALILHPRDRLPPLDGVVADLGPGDMLYVSDANGRKLWHGRAAQPVSWIRLVVKTRELGVIVAFGPELDDPYRDHETDLMLAIHDGAAVGATALVRQWRP